MFARATVIVAAMLATPAAASTIEALSPARLYAESDLVVDGTVIATRSQWDARHTGLETVATIAITQTWRGGASTTVEIVVPGGTLDGARHIFLGAPTVDVGERARWFLRDRGDGRLGIYGWSQGKWSFTKVTSYTTNGMKWPASPVNYRINRTGSDNIPLAQVIGAVDAAFATWAAVPCSTLRFRNAGLTNRTLAVDGRNVILFIETGWVYGAEAAAATSLWIIDGEQTADIAINGDDYTWAIGPPNTPLAGLLDLQAVLTHEIGHFVGLGHSDRAFDTMYYTWKPWQSQRTLSIDDKLGLCSLYPRTGDECPPACPADETCNLHPLGRLCEGIPDPIGSPCHADRVECDHFCLFTAADLSSGYCSQFCTTDADCPLTHHCASASAGEELVKVCFEGPQPAQPTACVADDSCPGGQHCDAEHGTCTFECRTDDDCEHSRCDERGYCVDGEFVVGGGGCATGNASLGWCLLLLGLRRRR